MKRILLILTLIMPLFCFSQTTAPKKANTIILKTGLSADEAFKNFGRILIKEGFTMETLDKDFYMLSTKVKTCNYGMLNAAKLNIKINCQIDQKEENTEIKITGSAIDVALSRTLSFDANSFVVSNRGPKSSVAGASWLIMDGLAKKLEGAEISYLIE